MKKKKVIESKKKRILLKKDKRKITELKSSLKIKEISSGKKESELEEEIELMSVPKFEEILKATESSPVLERVAVAENQANLEQEIASAPAAETSDDKGGIKYQDIGSYESIGGEGGYSITDNKAGDNFHYATSSDIQRTGFQDDEENIETRRRISRGDMSNQTGNAIEPIPGLEDTAETRETKKHLIRGDYNS